MDEAKELQQMLEAYAKQEIVDPLKTLGSVIGMGLVGAVMMFLGMLFTGIGILRYLQDKVDSFSGGSWGSLAPYAITVVVLLLGIALLVRPLLSATEEATS